MSVRCSPMGVAEIQMYIHSLMLSSYPFSIYLPPPRPPPPPLVNTLYDSLGMSVWFQDVPVLPQLPSPRVVEKIIGMMAGLIFRRTSTLENLYAGCSQDFTVASHFHARTPPPPPPPPPPESSIVSPCFTWAQKYWHDELTHQSPFWSSALLLSFWLQSGERFVTCATLHRISV